MMFVHDEIELRSGRRKLPCRLTTFATPAVISARTIKAAG